MVYKYLLLSLLPWMVNSILLALLVFLIPRYFREEDRTILLFASRSALCLPRHAEDIQYTGSRESVNKAVTSPIPLLYCGKTADRPELEASNAAERCTVFFLLFFVLQKGNSLFDNYRAINDTVHVCILLHVEGVIACRCLHERMATAP